MAVLVDGPHLEGIRRLSLQILKQEFRPFDGGVQHSAEFDFIEIGIWNSVPRGLQGIGRRVFLRHRSIGGSGQRAGRKAMLFSGFKPEPFHGKHRGGRRNIRRAQFHQQLRVPGNHLFLKIAPLRREPVQVGSPVIKINILPGLEILHGIRFRQINAVFPDFGGNPGRLLRHVDAELRSLLLLEAVEIPHRRMNGDGHVVLVVHPGFNQSADAFAGPVFFRHAVVVIHGEGSAAVRIKLVNAQVRINFRDIVARIRHGNNRAVFDEHGQFPQRRVNIIINLAALIQIPGEIINPLSFRQVNAVADVIPLLVRPGFLVNGSHQKIGAVQELVLRRLPQRVGIGIFQEHGPDHGQSGNGLLRDAVGVREQFRLELEIPPVNGSIGFPEGVGILFIGSPAVHIQLHGGERFPLEITDIHQRVLAAENAVHVRTDVGLPGKSGADVGGNMETDVLPDAARLVARPDAGIPLGSRPAVQGNDERAAVVPVVGHDLGHVRNAVQPERIARAYPGHVRLQHAHSGVPHLLHDIPLQQSADFRLGMQVGLGPQPDFHAVLPGVVRQTLQIRNIAVQGIRLAVPGSVAVVRQKPSQRHVMGLVTVHDGAAGKLVIIQFPVQGFLNASVILLAFLVPFPVLKQDAFFIFLPVIPVIGVQMPLVKGELGQQNGSAGKLVEIP